MHNNRVQPVAALSMSVSTIPGPEKVFEITMKRAMSTYKNAAEQETPS